jgi:nucleotidyltransferase/DNA polymerase involved in DNA repair
MLRIACLHIPRFQIVVHQKHEALKEQPFALVTGKLTAGGYNCARIFMCSEKASQQGVLPEMRLSEAKAVCSELILQELDQNLYAIARRQLTSILISCSPKVTTQDLGDFLLDASGLLHMGGEGQFCHNVLKICSRSGFTNAYIGIADSAFAATVATRLKTRRLFIIPHGQDASFLAPLSIKHLKLDPAIESSLLDLGVKSMEQLTNMPVQSLLERFGTEGRIAHELAQGVDSRKPTIPELEDKFECLIDMGGAVSSLNETMFALKSMLDRLTSELKQHGLSAEELILSFYNELDNFNERTLKLIRPSNHPQFLLQVVKLSLETNPLEREFTRMKLVVSRSSDELWEQPSIDPNKFKFLQTKTPEQIDNQGSDLTKLPSSLLLLLQRFLTSIGGNTTVKAIASDHYTFDTAGSWASVTQKAFSNSIIPINLDYTGQISETLLPADMVLRKHLIQVLVELKDNLPSAINYQKQWYRIKCITKPECLSVLWWDKLSSKDYYRVLAEPVVPKQAPPNSTETQTAYLMLLTHNKESGAWHIEGFFD